MERADRRGGSPAGKPAGLPTHDASGSPSGLGRVHPAQPQGATLNGRGGAVSATIFIIFLIAIALVAMVALRTGRPKR